MNDLNKIIEMKSNDLRAKQQALVECQCELQRVRDCNNKLSHDVHCLKVSNDQQMHENCELKKELECFQQRNAELNCNSCKAKEKLESLESQLCCTKNDNDCARKCNCELKHCQEEKLKERDSLVGHVACLTNQNHELSKELSHFVEQDEILRE